MNAKRVQAYNAHDSEHDALQAQINELRVFAYIASAAIIVLMLAVLIIVVNMN